MLIINELRVGSIIQDIETKLHFEVKGIDAEEMRVKICNSNKWWEISDFEPVILTEEWLEKFGFLESFSGSKSRTLHIKYQDTNAPCKLQIGMGDSVSISRAGVNAITTQCEYVHQLQNLYFALTGEELTLN